MTTRISKRKLWEYRQMLSQRDMAILCSIRTCHFLKTDQVGRLHFANSTTSAATLRETSRSLKKLWDFALIQPLRRRIGGVRAGSSSYVWTLKNAGLELLQLTEGKPLKTARKRAIEPSYIFLKHTLAIAELYTHLRTKTHLIQAEFEPSCWRGYITTLGVNIILKPDLFAITTTDKFEDYWFFEVDLDTEAPSRIVRKCEVYGRYCLTESEQKRIGVFPRVVWIVPDEKRQQSLKRHIGEQLSEYTDLFVVTTFEGLEGVIGNGGGH